MKRTAMILIAALALLASSCNLDNAGILYRGPDRTISDNMNRNYIGQNADSLFITTENGLERIDLNSSSFTSTLILDDPVFDVYLQDRAVLDDSGYIIYLDDNDPEKTSQQFYLIDVTDLNDVKMTAVDSFAADKIFVDAFTADSENYFIANDGTVYSVTTNGETVTENEAAGPAGSLYSNIGGLRIFAEYDHDNDNVTSASFYYLGQPLKFPGDYKETDLAVQIRSVWTDGTDLYVITNDTDDFHLFRGSTVDGELTHVKSYSGIYNRAFPCTKIDDNIVFLHWNGSSTPSRLVTLALEKEDSTHNPTSNGIEAEVFFTHNGSNYMLSKDHGMFQIVQSDSGYSLQSV